MANIVTIGGGNGQSSLLRGLKHFDHNLTAVVTMMDNGGSSGLLREQYGVMPPGDIRRCISVLSSDDALYNRWEERDEEGHTAGNIEIIDLVLQMGWEEALRTLHAQYGVAGSILPVTLQPTHLVARDDIGRVYFGEVEVGSEKEDTHTRITDMWLAPEVHTTSQVVDALERADVIVFSMGDVYTSIIPNLLVDGVVHAIRESGALVVLVCNKSQKRGETDHFSVLDIYTEFSKYLGDVKIDTLLVDNGAVLNETPEKTIQLAAEIPCKVLKADMADPQMPARLSGEKVATVINELCASL